MSNRTFGVAADLLLAIHFGVVLFIVGGLAAIGLGYWRNWRWVRHPAFRWGHLAAIAVVAGQALLGKTCPLTDWEQALRRQAGGGGRYEGSFISHWIQRIIFYEAEPWVFTLSYVVFFAAVVSTFWLVPLRTGRPDGGAENSKNRSSNN